MQTHPSTAPIEQAPNTIPARICLEPGCGKRLHSDNKKGYCTEHHYAKNRTTYPKACIGMKADSNHILVRCPKVFIPSRSSVKYHSVKCQVWTRDRDRAGLKLGNTYVKHRRTKQYPPMLCKKGWTIRDGVIARCTEPFTQRHPSRRYHSDKCSTHTLAWQRLGRHLGDSVRRICHWRECGKEFDKIRRNANGRYFCCKAHKTAERNARTADEKAELKRLRALGGQRKHKADRERRPFEIGLKVEGKIPQNRKNDKRAIVVARQIVSDETRLQYDVVAQYHKRFRATVLHPV